MFKKTRRLKTRQRPKNLKCFFCENKEEPDYKKPEVLKKFISSRGKILRREDIGCCQRHQRRLRTNIKRLRFLSLLPFTRQI